MIEDTKPITNEQLEDLRAKLAKGWYVDDDWWMVRPMLALIDKMIEDWPG